MESLIIAFGCAVLLTSCICLWLGVVFFLLAIDNYIGVSLFFLTSVVIFLTKFFHTIIA